MIKFYPMLLYVMECLLTYQLPPNLSLSYSEFSTPDHRALQTPPIGYFILNTWALVWTSMPANWVQVGTGNALPMASNGTNGVSVIFLPDVVGYYNLQFTFTQDSTQAPQNLSLSLNNVAQSMQTFSSSTSTLKFILPGQYFNIGAQSLYIWMDSIISITSMVIAKHIKMQDISIHLHSHPYNRELYVTTNLSYASIGSLAIFNLNSKVFLGYNLLANDSCLLSVGAPTNPADFSAYTNATNFTELSLYYSYSVAPADTALIPSALAGTLMIVVENISVDCSVLVNIVLPQGQIYNDGYWTIFSPQIDPVISYIETTISSSKNYTLLYIINQQYLKIHILDLQFNVAWDIESLKQHINISTIGGPCNIFYVWYWMIQVEMFCYNSTPADISNQISISVPSGYLREVGTNRLHSINLVLNQSVMEYVKEIFVDLQIRYYQLEQKLYVVFNITIESPWSTNLSTQNVIINVNGVQIPYTDIFFVTHPLGYVQAYTILQAGLIGSDTVTASFNSQWNLFSIEGYHYSWTVVSAYPVQFLPSEVSNQKSQLEPPGIYNFIQKPLKVINYYIQGWNFFVFSYFINNLINFQNLICMYYFMNFKNSLNNYRKGIYQTLLTIQTEISYDRMIYKIFNIRVDLSITETNPDPLLQYKKYQNQLNLYDFGFTVQFLNNNFQSLLQIFLLLLKILLLKIMCCVCCSIFKRLIFLILRSWSEFLLMELVLMTSAGSIVLGSYLTPYNSFGFLSRFDKLNFSLNILSYFLSIFSVFLLSIYETHQIRMQINSSSYHLSNIQASKTQKNSKISLILYPRQRKKVINISLNRFLDKSLFALIPFFIAVDSNVIFISFMSFITLFQLYRVIMTYSYYSKTQFIKQLIIKVIWILFHAIYVFYWLTEILWLECSQGVMVQVMRLCDISESILLIVGCFIQMIWSICQILYNMYIILKKIIKDSQKSNKIHSQDANNHRQKPIENHKGKNNNNMKKQKNKQNTQKRELKNIKKYVRKRKSRFAAIQNFIYSQTENQNNLGRNLSQDNNIQHKQIHIKKDNNGMSSLEKYFITQQNNHNPSQENNLVIIVRVNNKNINKRK